MSLGGNDYSAWRHAMTAHGTLNTTQGQNYFANGYSELKPLGSMRAITAFIERQIEKAESLVGPGNLPRIHYVPVNGSDTPLGLPTHGLPPEVVASFEAAAQLGVDEVASVARSLEGLAETAQAQEALEDDLQRQGLDAEEIRDRLRAVNAEKDPPSSTAARNMLETHLHDEGLRGEELDRAVEEAMSQAEREGKAVEDGAASSVQRYAAIATTAGACLDSVLGIDTDTDLAVDIAAAALRTIGGICSTVGGLTSSTVVGAVFQILAVLCNLVAAILDYVRGWTISAEEGVNRDWDTNDRHYILRHRLVILAQCDVEGCKPGKWSAWISAWEKAMAGRGGTERTEILENLIYQTAKNRGEDRVAAAQSACLAMDGSGNSLRMCQEIRDWLAYIGVPERDCNVVYAWLYEARQVTEVVQQRMLLSKKHDWRGSGAGWLDRSDMGVDEADDCYFGNCRCGHRRARHDSEPNMYWGTDNDPFFNITPPGWYEACRNLPEYVPFTVHHLHDVHQKLMDRLKIVPSAPKGTPPVMYGESTGYSEHVSSVLRPDWPNPVIRVRMPLGAFPGQMKEREYTVLVLMSPGLVATDIWLKGYGTPFPDSRRPPRYLFYRLQADNQSWGVWCSWIRTRSDGTLGIDPNTGGPWRFGTNKRMGPADKATWALMSTPEFKEALLSRIPRARGGVAGAVVGVGAIAAVAAAIYFLPK